MKLTMYLKTLLNYYQYFILINLGSSLPDAFIKANKIPVANPNWSSLPHWQDTIILVSNNNPLPESLSKRGELINAATIVYKDRMTFKCVLPGHVLVLTNAIDQHKSIAGFIKEWKYIQNLSPILDPV